VFVKAASQDSIHEGNRLGGGANLAAKLSVAHEFQEPRKAGTGFEAVGDQSRAIDERRRIETLRWPRESIAAKGEGGVIGAGDRFE
jgi:hypothetical protein